ncbi:kinase-like protein [Gigaspora margarita]|uniref:Kinase-like protein n=1 Tax=Gigaspora margarita TaxID=4874 RepID=A0A8H4B2D5_GIGMA|nr:kinase-like protein [Gigaspora margarita]
MSNRTSLLVDYSEKLENDLKASNIENFNYSQFSKPERIGSGGYAVVYSTIFQEKKYALKSLNNNLSFGYKEFKLFMRELQLLHTVNHPNVVKFYGISRDSQTKNFMLVLQFADCGNLRDFLKLKSNENNNYYRISWAELIKIAMEITLGLKYLHENNIIHRDLHSKNILLDNGKVLIADFGISKRLDDTTTTSSVKGIEAYIDPRCFNPEVKRDKKFDIYSLGVLLWELMKGIPPPRKFENIIKDISRSKEKYIGDISLNKENNSALSEYADIYIKCWSPALEQRPKLDNILETLENISKKTTAEFIEISNQQITRLTLYCSERLDSSNDMFENINIDTHHEDNQKESNNDNFDEYENNTQSNDDIVDGLNEPCEVVSKNELTVLNEGMHLPAISNIGSGKMIQIPFETIDKIWNFFVTYFLNTGLLWIFQPYTRDIVECERCGGIWVFIQILINLSHDLYYIGFFFFTKKS